MRVATTATTKQTPLVDRSQLMARYAAKLLFQFRVVVDGDPGKRRVCEERIVVLKARSAREALAKAKRKGKGGTTDYLNDDGNTVHFDFVGVMDLLQLGPECEADEVWYDVRQRLLPMERRTELIPSDSRLLKSANGRR